MNRNLFITLFLLIPLFGFTETTNEENFTLQQGKNISQTEKKYFPDRGENNGRLIALKNV